MITSLVELLEDKDGERVHYKFNLAVPNEALEKPGWEESKEL